MSKHTKGKSAPPIPSVDEVKFKSAELQKTAKIIHAFIACADGRSLEKVLLENEGAIEETEVRH